MQTDSGLQIGQVKWFGDRYFGFIRNYDDKEIFFHGRSAVDFDPLQLQYDEYGDVFDIVVYRIQPSKRKPNSVEAVDVRRLETLKCRDQVASILFTLNIKPGDVLFEELALHYRALLTKDAVDPNDTYTELMQFDIFSNQTGQQLKRAKLIGLASSILPQPHYVKFAEKLLADMTDEHALDLYLRGHVKLFPRHYGEISRVWHDFSKELQEKIFDDSPPESDAFKNLFHERILLENDEQRPFETFDLIQSLIDMHPEQGDYTINFVESKLCSPVLKTLLWIHDTSKTDIGINEISSAASIISNQDQQLLVKKLFKYIHLKNPIITYKQLYEIPWTDISTWVALELLELCKYSSELKSNEVEKKVYEIIINHISNPKDTIDFHGFFDKCPGRKRSEYYNEDGIRIYSPDKLEEGESYTRVITDYETPRDITYCEGRKPAKRDEFGYEFWWCRNISCAENAISECGHGDYNDYTLWDFFLILGIEYSVDSYQRILGYLNRIKKLFAHMHCRECKHLMHPVTNSNYAFYRVSRFICKNHDCENDNEVFLTHCINGRCTEIIDSRDCIKCKPRDRSKEQFGWYICTRCFACCNTTILKNRKEALVKLGKTYFGHLTGHKHDMLYPEDENDNVRSLISCPQCAGLLDFSENEDPKNILKWLEKEQDNTSIIHTYGKNKRGMSWWLVKESGFAPGRFEAFRDKIHATGLELSKAKYPGSHFVNEPNDNFSALKLTCDSCSFELSGKEVKERIELRYHPIIYDKLKN